MITWSVLGASRVGLLVLMVASFAGGACIWHGDRSLSDDTDAGDEADLGNGEGGFAIGTGGGAGGTGVGGNGDGGGIAGNPGMGGGSGGASGTGGTGTGGAGQGGSVDASQPDTGEPDLTSSSDATNPPLNCGPTGTVTRVWSFNTDVEGWDLADGTSLIWTGAVGNPAPGALQADWAGAAPVHPRRIEAFGDLRGHVLTARVWVDPRAVVTVKVFVQTGVRYWWADGGIVTPPPGQWTCVTLDVDNPVYSRIQYDPTDVTVLGLELQTSGSGRVYIDQVEY